MKFLSFTDTHIEKNEPVLVFGNLGISRCVTVIVAYLMHHFKQSLEVGKHALFKKWELEKMVCFFLGGQNYPLDQLSNT